MKANSELIIDNFAGGGGASCGIEMALNRSPDVAINHCRQAVAMHRANHPRTVHLTEDVFDVDPHVVCAGRPVGLAWFSPDCKHFSKAKGGKPRSKKIRGLAWVMVKWCALVRPRVCVLENVEEFQSWGPLLANGAPCPRRKGKTFKSFVKRLMNLGYQVEWRELRACDYGAPTIRKRLFLIARCDGEPIVWPSPSHCDPARPKRGLAPWRTAAECIDWRMPCVSIFLTRERVKELGLKAKRPLVEATNKRIARGVFRYVLNAKEPFIVPLTHQGGNRVEAVSAPMRTVTGAHRGEKALCVPFLTEHANASTQRVFPADGPLRTQCAEIKGGHFALVTAFLARHFDGNYRGPGSDLAKPMPTVTARDHNALITAHLAKFYGTTTGQDVRGPLHTITSGAAGGHHALVFGFLLKYYSEGGQDSSLLDPMHTVTANDRMALVTVDGREYALDDIGMRMLRPRELFLAQGFHPGYVIEFGEGGKRLSDEAQVRMCGNSVPPPLAAAIVEANVPEMKVRRKQLVDAPLFAWGNR